jgi:Flp pilus assembly protein TadB
MTALVVATVFGFGLLLVFDGLVRPGIRVDPLRRFKDMGPAGLGGIGGGFAALFATGWPVAAIAGVLVGSSVPRVLTGTRDERVRLAKREAIAEVAARLRDAIRSGIGLQDALAQAAGNAPAAIRTDLRRLSTETGVSGLATAAASFSERVNDPAGELLASALSFADRMGSRNLSEVLDSLAEATAAQAATVREAKARQTRARMSARIVASVPIFLLLAIRRANPAYLAPFSTPGGQVVLAFALGLVWAGYRAMKRAARIEGGAS